MSTSNQFGKYEILEEIGRGGFAVVYRARDTTLDRVVALKVLAPHLTWDPRFVERFHQEAKAVARLRHPNIVVVHEIGEQAGQIYIAMEYLDGRTLAQVIAAEGALPLDRATAVLGQVADALDYAHEQGVLHRDAKPANIMVEEGGRVGLHTTLMDFGLVKAMESNQSLTSMGTVLGSPEYMAPEQADSSRKDEIGPATDRYALGVVAYHALTGRVPFSGPTTAVLHAHAYESPPDPQSIRESLSSGVARVLLKALSKEAENRYASATEMVEALQGAAETRESIPSQRQPSPIPPPQPTPAEVVTRVEKAPAPEQETGIAKVQPEPDVAEQAPKTLAASQIEALAQRVSEWLSALDSTQRTFWQRWVVVNAGGSVTAQIITAVAIQVTRGEMYCNIGWAVGGFTLWDQTWWLAGFLFAVAIGITQWIALQRRVPWAHWWALASAVASVPGWIAGALAVHGLHALVHYSDFVLVWVALWLAFAVIFQTTLCAAQWIVFGSQAGQSARWLWAGVRGAAVGGAVGGVLAWAIFQLGRTDISNVFLCLAAGAVGRIAYRTISETIIGLTLARLVRTEQQTGT